MRLIKKKRMSRIKIDHTELIHFQAKDLVVDSYWNDLYNPPEYPRNQRVIKKWEKVS